jgi:16S rRNA (guanine966-N2)-methyltransferase
MRIISGNFKGRKILTPNDIKTRPLKDLTKESIFNILKHSNKFNVEIKNSVVLDLFAGVGSFGIECLSNDAKYVTFVENYNGVLPILKKNLSNLKLDKKYEIIEQNIFSGLKLAKSNYDIIFLDPPYKDKNISELIDKIFEINLLSKSGIIITHRNKNVKEKYSKNFRILEEKTYGISKISFGNLN